VDRAIAALNVELSSDHLLDAYEHILIELWDCVNSHEQYGIEMGKFGGGVPDHIGGNSVGLHLVRVIRNKFAHGDYVSIEPSGWGEEQPGRQIRDIERESKPIALSTHLMLMSIQMLIISDLSMLKLAEECVWSEREFRDADIPLPEIMRVLHLVDYGMTEVEQMTLDLS
jgi:hypothetical protein